MKKQTIEFEPIGIVESELKYRYETPRQGVLAGEKTSVINLIPGRNFEQALKDIDGFSRLWIIYQFHLNNNWKPLVTPPRHTRKKIGVFATRAPYRPNQIGMSCVKLENVNGLKIFISESDILDGSPVLDIKPYLPYSDSFPDAKTGWVKHGLETIYAVNYTQKAETQMQWLYEQSKINLKSYAKLQLEFNPSDTSRKRISIENDNFILAYRTWRIIYRIDDTNKVINIISIRSGYTAEELADSENDRYGDKALHLLTTDH